MTADFLVYFMQAHGLAEYIAQVRHLTIHVIGYFENVFWFGHD